MVKSKLTNENGSEQEEYLDILKVLREVCKKKQLQMTDDAVTHSKDVGKWSVPAKSIIEDDGDVFYLEAFKHKPKTCVKIRQKLLEAPNFMPFEYSYSAEGMHCFVYKSLGTVKDFFTQKEYLTQKERETFAVPIIRDVMSAVVVLNSLGYVHQQLNWENIHVDRCDFNQNYVHGKLSALEHVVKFRNVKPKRMSSKKHLPPGVLKSRIRPKLTVSKVESYILSSQALELVLGKCMGGKDFAVSKQNISQKEILDNVKNNSASLKDMLGASSLPEELQNFFLATLELRQVKRPLLSDALNMLDDICNKYYPNLARNIFTVPLKSPISGVSVTIEQQNDIEELPTTSNPQHIFAYVVILPDNSAGTTPAAAETSSKGSETSIWEKLQDVEVAQVEEPTPTQVEKQVSTRSSSRQHKQRSTSKSSRGKKSADPKKYPIPSSIRTGRRSTATRGSYRKTKKRAEIPNWDYSVKINMD